MNRLWIVLALVLASCGEKTSPKLSFYYWKTVFRLGDAEEKALAAHRVNRLYIRYFDIAPDGDAGRPEATVLFGDSLPAGMATVPVIFIVNKVLETAPTDSISGLAGKICTRVAAINQTYHIANIPEIQVDCDWNAATREKYFQLLRFMQHQPLLQGRQLSVTLRLHQLKYRKSTGIPPVDKVALMCYNMGRLTSYGNCNSILDVAEAKAYTEQISLYPLPVDVALPLFHWGVRFSNRQYRGLINGLCKADMVVPCFAEIAPDLYRADTTMVLRGAYIRQGEHIRIEEPSADAVRQVAKNLARRIKKPEYIIWFHLDSLLLQKKSNHAFQEISDLFR
jgi:hypothetical protein